MDAFSRIVVLDSVDSTNEELRRLAVAGTPEGTVVIADHQSAGRGRFGRRWLSTRGLGLYVSVLFRPREDPRRITRWTVGAAVAACEACRDLTGREVSIEWPNDLVYGNRKVAGVLAELRTGGARINDLILGTGFNVHHTEADFPPELAGRASSLHLVRGAGILDRERLAIGYLRRLAVVSARLCEGHWESVAASWESMAPGGRGRLVRVRSRSGTRERWYEGITRGLDERGALRVEGADGVAIAVSEVETVQPMEA